MKSGTEDFRVSLWLIASGGSRSHPRLGIRPKEASNVSLNVVARDPSAVLQQKSVGVSEDTSQSPACVVPFVDDLLEHAGIGMLRNETHSQHFDTFACNLLND